MQVTQELFEMFVAIVPAMPALYVTIKPATTLPGWVAQVITACFVALLGIGLTLTRLTATCSSIPVGCPPGLEIVNRSPGVINSCGTCLRAPAGLITTTLNEWALSVQACAGALCLLVSFSTTIRFILWTRKHQS